MCTHLYCPEVTGEKQDDGHHVCNEASIDKFTEQVGEDCADSEEQVEESSHWMPGGTFRHINSPAAGAMQKKMILIHLTKVFGLS